MKNFFRLSSCRKLILLFILFAGPLSTVFSQEKYWQQEVNFRIDVTLNDQEHSLDAFEKISYTNHSPDTLSFIWFHIWPNAFKNDRTAFSGQLLLNGRTDFYFAGREQRGYINRLDFKVNGVTATMEDHPQHTDIVKVILPQVVLPGQTIIITTPFHVQLPENFSRGGHRGQSYQVTQWFPKPAVYDRKGWHPMPYLDQGEFYSEFGNYEVLITVPANYIVAATGRLQDTAEKKWLQQKAKDRGVEIQKLTGKKSKREARDSFPPSASDTKSLLFIQNRVHDFAWFADKRFIVNYDTLALSSGSIIDVFSYYLPSATSWKNSIRYLKDAVLTRSAWLGEYPYGIISAVEAEMGVVGGMEYPTITSVYPLASEKENDLIIAHEVGHNWFQGILASNERDHPWMDEGMNSYYDNRYLETKYPPRQAKENFQSKRVPEALDHLLFETSAAMKKDQPINTASADFSDLNFGLIAYHKAALWMKALERFLGKTVFDSCMKAYYSRWQFKHPYPEDFQAVIESVSGREVDHLFDALNKKGSLQSPLKKKPRLTSYFNLKNTDQFQYLSIAPAAGFNRYDGVQVGALLHNYQLPLPPFRFLAAPLYGTGSGKLNGLARASYNWYPETSISHVETGAGFSSFSMDDFKPEQGERSYRRFRKVAPFISIGFRQPPLSTVNKSLQLKWYFINEDALEFKQEIIGTDTTDIITSVNTSTVIGELKYQVTNSRVLYPYQAGLNLQYHRDFIRAGFTGNYFFNYPLNKGGIKVRWFAGKFMYTPSQDNAKRYETDRYHLNLTGPRGEEDYTYSNYFIGRNEFEGLESQQLMIRDGGFKVGTDLLGAKAGKTDDWLAALNFTIHVPNISDRLPVKLFFDIGTYSEAWQKNGAGSRFLYDAGLQVGLFKEMIKVYIPLLYSSVYKDYFRSTLGDQRFLKTISFSIDIQDHKINRLHKQLAF